MGKQDTRPYDDNGDMRGKDGMLFRQVGWIINGGPNDGIIVQGDKLSEKLKQPHGGFSPVYIQIGD